MRRVRVAPAACAALVIALLAQSADAAVPRDEYFEHQWGMTQINATRAWTVTQGNSSVVAVIDTGVDPDHPDLPRVLAGADLIDDDNDASDENGHGTLIAGIIAAATDRTGIAGVAPAARILPIRVLGKDGTGDASDVADGIDLAVRRGAHVINLSLAEVESADGDLGGLLRAPEVDLAIRRAASRGRTVVIAAGNDHENGGEPPTAYDATVNGVLVVGASTREGRPAAYSRYGKGLDLLAPGGGDDTNPSDDLCDEKLGIVSTWWDPAERESGYGAACGSSMAVGFVSGVAALLHTRGYTNAQISRRILATARDIGPKGRDDKTGAGLLDAGAALGVKAPTRRSASATIAPPKRPPSAVASPNAGVAAPPPSVLPSDVAQAPPIVPNVGRRQGPSRESELALAMLLIVLVGLGHALRLDPTALRWPGGAALLGSAGVSRLGRSSATGWRWRARS